MILSPLHFGSLVEALLELSTWKLSRYHTRVLCEEVGSGPTGYGAGWDSGI